LRQYTLLREDVQALQAAKKANAHVSHANAAQAGHAHADAAENSLFITGISNLTL